MTANDFKRFQETILENENFQKSCSKTKFMQFTQFVEGGQVLNGQKIRREDAAGNIEGDDGFDATTAHFVIYNFKNGFLHSTNGEPAVQAPGCWEIWKNGEILKVVSDGGRSIEYWENGVPVRFETVE